MLCVSDSPSSATPRSVFGSGLLVLPRLINDLPVPVHQPDNVDPNSLQRLQLPLRVDLRTSSKQQGSGISYAPDHRKRKEISPAQCRAESGELSLLLYTPLGHSTSLRPRNSLQVARATKGAHLSKTCLCCIREASTKVYGKDEALGCQRAAGATDSLSPLLPTRPVSWFNESQRSFVGHVRLEGGLKHSGTVKNTEHLARTSTSIAAAYGHMWQHP
ncbi:hypothetical protein MRX96_016008 [Rhipicephalus microplus]